MSTRRQHFVRAIWCFPGNQSPREKSCSWVVDEWNVPGPGSLYVFSLICTTPDKLQACTECDAGHAVVVRWEIHGVRGCGGYPPWGDWRRGAYLELSLPRGSTLFWHTRLGWAVGRPTWIWSVASHAHGPGCPGPRRTSFWYILPSCLSPSPVRPWSQGYSGSWAVRVPRDPRTEWNTIHVWVLLKVNVSCVVYRIHFRCCVCFGCPATWLTYT